MASTWTAGRMPDCTGTTVLITGANSGLGFEATKAFAANGATVIMACRSTDRGEQAAAEIQDDTAIGESALDVRRCDLTSLASVEAFAEDVAESYDSLDVLCNNAGVMALPRQETDDGFEKQFGVNHLGHFALTGRLLDLLVESDGESRVVTHSSGAHEFGEGAVEPPDILKIDAEGADAAVLSGLQETIAAHRPRRIYCEVHVDGDEIRELLSSFGYSFEPIASTRPVLRAVPG